MNTYRKTAIVVGTLFIIGTVAGVLSRGFTSPVLDASDYLMKISAGENQIIIGALFVLIMGLALAMVPVTIFPVLKKYNEPLALGYIVFRGGLETVTYLGWVISWLLLVSLSQLYLQTGTSDASSFQAWGALLRKAGETSGTLTAIIFPLGALMFYYVLYQSKLVPRWISVWGFIAITLSLAAGLLQIFGLSSSSASLDTMLNLPIFLQEMVMAVWLIVKGFNPSAIAFGSAKVAVN